MEIIAELGSNWNEANDILRMIDQCAKSGIKYAKLQLFQADQVPEEYQNKVLDEMTCSTAFHYALASGVELFFSVCYPEAVEICERIGVQRYKVRFVDRNNLILYRAIRKTRKPVFVSCQRIWGTIWQKYIERQGGAFLYCIPRYPALRIEYNDIPAEINGISDHTNDLNLLSELDQKYDWFEMHMKLDNNCLETEWSKSFDEYRNLRL